MQSHRKLSDATFLRKFRACEIEPSAFTHEAHLRLAWIQIRKYGLARAEKNIQEKLKSYVKWAGAPEKYHTTLTVAAVRMVDHFMEKSSTNNFWDFIDEYPALINDFKSLINSHYSFDIFKHNRARLSYVAPDLAPF